MAEVQFLQSLNFNHVNLTIVKLVGAGVLREKRNKMSKIGVKEQNNLSNAKAFFNKQSLGQKKPLVEFTRERPYQMVQPSEPIFKY